MNISADVVAWYGAILATIGVAFQLLSHYRDRANIYIKVQRDMMVYGNNPIYDKKKVYINITVINRGRRPINISKAGIRTFSGDSKFALLTDSFMPHRQRILTEKDPVSEFMMEQDERILAGAWYVCVFDATGREYRKYLHKFPSFWRIYYWLRHHN